MKIVIKFNVISYTSLILTGHQFYCLERFLFSYVCPVDFTGVRSIGVSNVLFSTDYKVRVWLLLFLLRVSIIKSEISLTYYLNTSFF